MRNLDIGVWYLVVVSVLAVVLLVGLPDDAEATYYNVYDARDIRIYYENLDGRSLYQGDKDIEFDLRVLNGNVDTMTDDNPIQHVIVTIETQVFDEEGHIVDTPVSRWTTRTVDADATIYDGSYRYFYDFKINLKPDAVAMRYNFSVRVDYQTSDGHDNEYTGYIHWTLSPSIIAQEFPSFYPGMIDRSSQVRLDVRRTMSEMELTLESPNADFTFFGGQVKVMANREAYTSSDWYPTFLISVDRWAKPGTYEGPYTIHYKNQYEVRCTEKGNVVFNVYELPMVEVRASASAITQGTTETSLTLTVRNTGTTRLYDVEIAISSVSSEYFWLAPDHFEGDDPISNRWIWVGDVDTWGEISVLVNVSLDQMIPQGAHKLMFDFRAVYRDYWTDEVLSTSGTWTSSTEGMVPRVSMRTGTINLNPLNYDVDGMNLRMIVADLDMDVMISSVLTSSFGTQKENLEVAFYLRNHGAVEYRDVTVQLGTGTQMTPFVNPVLPGEDLSESFTMPGTLSPGDQVRVSIYVDLSETATPGTYDVPVLVTGDETRTGQPLSGELTLRVLVTGDGPKLNIRAVSPSTISCVGDFTLTLTVDNMGDDTARGIVLGTRQAAEGMTPPEGAMRPFEPLALPMYLDDMVPGNTSMVEIPMRCNPGLEDEMAYPILFTLDYVDSQGNHPSAVQAVQEVSIKVERGYGPALEFRTVSPETFKAGEDFTLSLALFNTGDEVAHNVVLGMGPQEVQSEGSEPPSRETPPQPTTLPLYLGDIEPDKFVMVEIDMRCNKDMMEGHVYAMCFFIDYTNDAGEHPSDTEAQHQVSIRTKGTPVTAESTMYSTGNMLMYVLMICLIVVVAIYAIGTITRVQQGRRPKEEESTVVTPRPPTPAETQQYYADYGTSYHEPQDEQPSPQEQDAVSEEQASYDQPQEEAYTQEQVTAEADTSSYYENQLWGGGDKEGSEGSETQEPPPQ